MLSIFNAPRRYPRIYEPYYDTFNFYEGRQEWLDSISKAPREAYLLFSLHWLHLEVYNGGFWQYFFNSTGTSYPEAIEGFSAIGMPEVSEVVSRAALKLGDPYPLDPDQRRETAGAPDQRLEFDAEDTEFYDLADTKQFFRKVPKFVPLAEAYADAYEQSKKD